MKEVNTVQVEGSISCDSLYRHPAVYWLLGESLHPGGLSLTRRLAEKFHISAGSRVLDVATGRGASAWHLAKEVGCTVVGLDTVEEGLAIGDRLSRKERLGGSTAYVRGDAETLPIATDSFDAVICECSLSIFQDKPRASVEMARVLRPGGMLGISDVTCSGELPQSLQGAFSRAACLADVRNPEEYSAFLAGAGLQDIEMEDHGEELKALVTRIKRKLAPLSLMAKLRALRVPGLDSKTASRAVELLAEVEGLVREETLSYFLITARKP